MIFLVKLSSMIIPLLILYIVGYGLLMKRDVYQDFTDGAKDGIKVVVEILPTLIGLMVGVGILRESGFLDFVSGKLGDVLEYINFPAELMPLAVVKLFSSSAATGLALDIFKTYGVDSMLGKITALMLSSTETVFYTISVYYMSVKVKKTRWTIAGALVCTVSGIIASIMLAKYV